MIYYRFKGKQGAGTTVYDKQFSSISSWQIVVDLLRAVHGQLKAKLEELSGRGLA